MLGQGLISLGTFLDSLKKNFLKILPLKRVVIKRDFKLVSSLHTLKPFLICSGQEGNLSEESNVQNILKI